MFSQQGHFQSMEIHLMRHKNIILNNLPRNNNQKRFNKHWKKLRTLGGHLYRMLKKINHNNQ